MWPCPTSSRSARTLFTDYLFAFEITSVLLIIAVVGAVTLARHRRDRPSTKPPAIIPESDEVTA
jgi:hypothetical protein